MLSGSAQAGVSSLLRGSSSVKNAVAQTTNENANPGGAAEEQVVSGIKKLEAAAIQEKKGFYFS